MEQFLTNLQLPDLAVIIAYGVALLAALWLWLFYCPRLSRVRRATDADNQSAEQERAQHYLPPVSVIIYAQDQAENLERLLPQILNQDYAADFEVVVINEEQSEPTREVVERLQIEHPNLYLTFTPDGARNLSRKKLALTLGVKAARHEIVVMTEANTAIDSPRWLQLMVEPMLDPAIEVVLGFAQFDADEDSGIGSRRRAFTYAADAATWITAALAGKPYRGISYNLAYRRDTFFKNKGFSRSLNLHYGDDDIFINEIAKPTNTYVQLATDARVTIKAWNARRLWLEMKLHHDFTGQRIPRGARRFMGFSSLMFWMWFAASVVAVVFSFPMYYLTVAAVALLLIGLWIPVILTWRGLLAALGSRRLGFTLPWLIMTKPIATLVWRIMGRKRRQRNYTWH